MFCEEMAAVLEMVKFVGEPFGKIREHFVSNFLIASAASRKTRNDIKEIAGSSATEIQSSWTASAIAV